MGEGHQVTVRSWLCVLDSWQLMINLRASVDVANADDGDGLDCQILIVLGYCYRFRTTSQIQTHSSIHFWQIIHRQSVDLYDVSGIRLAGASGILTS